MRAIHRHVVAGCVAIAAALVFVLLLFRAPDAAEQQPASAQSAPSAAALALADASPVTTESVAARTPARIDEVVTFEVVDGASSEPLDGVRLGVGVVQRFAELASLTQFGATTDGRLTVPLVRLSSSEPDTRVVLTRRGYLPKVVEPPSSAGTCRVLMSRGRDAWVRIVDRSGAPVRGARVAFVAGNVDSRLLADYASGSECVADGEGAWFASVVVDDEGYAGVALPAREVLVLASCVGWFQAKQVYAPASSSERDRGKYGAQLVTLLEDASERGRALEVVMEPLQCAVVAARPSRILGKSIPRPEGRSWKEVHSIFAWMAATRVSRALQARFPGDLVFVECLVPATDAPREVPAPVLRMKVLVDGVGELDVQVALQRFENVRLESLQTRARPSAPLGNIAADVVPGYAREWPQQLYVVRDDGTKLPAASFELAYGDRCTVPVGRYGVHRRGPGGTSSEDLGTVDVTEGGTCRIDPSGHPMRWPVVLRVADEHGASPHFCSLRMRRRGIEEERRSSPREPGAYRVFLEEGVHDVFVSTDNKNWQQTEIVVRPVNNTCDVRVAW